MRSFCNQIRLVFCLENQLISADFLAKKEAEFSCFLAKKQVRHCFVIFFVWEYRPLNLFWLSYYFYLMPSICLLLSPGAQNISKTKDRNITQKRSSTNRVDLDYNENMCLLFFGIRHLLSKLTVTKGGHYFDQRTNVYLNPHSPTRDNSIESRVSRFFYTQLTTFCFSSNVWTLAPKISFKISSETLWLLNGKVSRKIDSP